MDKKMTLAEYDDLEYSETADYWREKADRRLELLREICEIEPCPMCWGWKTHSDKCPIGKELSVP